MRPTVGLALGCAALVVASLATVPLPASAHVNDVNADPQLSTDGTVVAESVFVAADGWLALYDRRSNGSFDGLLVRTRVASGGFREDVPVRIPADRWEEFGPNGTVHFVLHFDDGDGAFEPRGDDRVLTSFGSPAVATFALRQADRPAVVTARRFAPQIVDTNRVTVRRATLPGDGHLVLRNATGDGAGPVVGTRALSAGTHRNVTVEVDRSFYVRQDESFALRATLHRDDDGRFESGTSPVLAGLDPVSTVFGVRRGDDATPTPTPEEAALVRTATPTAAPSSPTPQPSTPAGTVEAGDPDGTGAATPAAAQTGGDGTGFGAPAAFLALALAAFVLGRRTRRA